MDINQETIAEMLIITEHEMKGEDINIVRFEKELPVLAKEFKRIQKEQYNTFARKMLSYGLGNIGVGSEHVTSEEQIKLSLTGIWFRVNDKIQRLKQLVVLNKENTIQDESIEDTLQDLSVYGIIALLVKGKFWKRS